MDLELVFIITGSLGKWQNSLRNISVYSMYQLEFVLSHLGRVYLFATLWTVAHEALLSMEFSRQHAGVGYHALLQGIFLTQELKQHLLRLLHWQAGTLPLCPLRSTSVGILTLYSSEITNRIRYISILLLNSYSMALY